MAQGKVMRSRTPAIVLGIKGEEKPRIIFCNWGKASQEKYEMLPRKLNEISGIRYDLPQVYSTEDAKKVINFYVKTNLRWPSMCAKCLNEPKKYERLERDFSSVP